ncbi:MAG: 4a-hydroxytetrahydrobiopterin dehydratase [Acidobacteriota bacterium]|nr:4a-hydroxytetrahydrobiopterin dehydratase [Acidobacteriota bacterium]
MTVPKVLDAAALETELQSLDGWSVVDGKLHKQYVFEDFVQAFGFMSSAALLAERSGHHPEWSNVYKFVRVDLVTHDAGGITSFDVELAREFDQAARLSSPKSIP